MQRNQCELNSSYGPRAKLRLQVVWPKHDSLLALLCIAVGRTESGGDDKPPRVQCIQTQSLFIKKCLPEIMISNRGMLSTRGKFQQPLNSLFKSQANSGHEALIQEGAEKKVCETKTEIQQSTRRIERKKSNSSFGMNESRIASDFFDSTIICSFFTCKYIFSYILQIYSHQFQALDFLYFLQLLDGNTSICIYRTVYVQLVAGSISELWDSYSLYIIYNNR